MIERILIYQQKTIDMLENDVRPNRIYIEKKTVGLYFKPLSFCLENKIVILKETFHRPRADFLVTNAVTKRVITLYYQYLLTP